MAASLHFPFASPPAPGELIPVAEGVFWIRMPLPFALDHINLWLLEEADGWTLVDCGIGTQAVKTLWSELLLGPLAGKPITRIIVTHFHPDHLGLANWLAQQFDAPILMTREEFATAQTLYHASPELRGSQQRQFFSAHGLSPQKVEEVTGSGNPYRQSVPSLPVRIEVLNAGSELLIGAQRWQALIGRGHSPEHLCLFCPALDLLIAGDQMLPTISPNVSVTFMAPQSEPLGLFLASLGRLRALPAGVRVLPAHGLVFEGLHARIDALQSHHDERLALLIGACAEPLCAAQTLRILFNRQFSGHEMFFALGEAVAHLHYLVAQGTLQRVSDDEGRLLFQTRAQADIQG